jgi:hypothetical protein
VYPGCPLRLRNTRWCAAACHANLFTLAPASLMLRAHFTASILAKCAVRVGGAGTCCGHDIAAEHPALVSSPSTHGPVVPHATGVSDGSHSREYVVTKNARTTFQARLKWRRNGVCSAVVTVVLDRRFWRVQTSWERHVTISWPRQPRFDSSYGQALGAGRIAAVVEVAHEWCVCVGQQSVRSLLPSQDGHAPLGLSTGT